VPDLNGVMMQYFHWYLPDDGTLWSELSRNAARLAELGVTSLWLPPATKGIGGGSDVGYGSYDLFDLGEFDQKGSVRTKYGTREEFLIACDACRDSNIRVYADAVFNHKMGGDAAETVRAHRVDPEDRAAIRRETVKIQAWTHFHFPGRSGRHSTMQWHWHHFQAVDQSDADGYHVYLFEGKQFDPGVDGEKGNFDFLMGCDVDMDHPEVVGELEHWGEWFVNTTGVDGFRFDAVKHIKPTFFRDWMNVVTERTGKALFGVGEYWSFDIEVLSGFLTTTEFRIAIFDAPLQNNFHVASRAGREYDLRKVFENTLAARHPMHAVTLVENHDTQPLQALEAVVEPWFKPLAYGLILLRCDGYPCVFYADYFGAEYADRGRDGAQHTVVMPSHKIVLDRLMRVRRELAFGDQHDYFDEPDCIGWTRAGDDEHVGGVAVVMSNGDGGSKRMHLPHSNMAYRDETGGVEQTVVTDSDGYAEFTCPAGCMSVWVPSSFGQ
jgi:alpha-amylase